MLKKALITAFICSIASAAVANASCDLSAAHFQNLAQNDLDKLYAFNSFNLKKPALIVNAQKGRSYYAEQLGAVITIYPKSFDDAYCDQYFDGLTPAVAQVVSHEYTHYIDGKLNLSKKIGEEKYSENTAALGEHAFDELIWHSGFFTDISSKSAQKKYQTFLNSVRPTP